MYKFWNDKNINTTAAEVAGDVNAVGLFKNQCAIIDKTVFIISILIIFEADSYFYFAYSLLALSVIHFIGRMWYHLVSHYFSTLVNWLCCINIEQANHRVLSASPHSVNLNKQLKYSIAYVSNSLQINSIRIEVISYGTS